MATFVEPTEEFHRNGEIDASAHSPTPRQTLSMASPSDLWLRTAPRRLTGGGLSPEDAWRVYWKKRQRSLSVAELCGASKSPLAWQINEAELPPVALQLLELSSEAIGSQSRKFNKPKHRSRLHDSIRAWLDVRRSTEATWQVALSYLAAASLVAEVGDAFEPRTGWELLDELFVAATDAQQLPPADATPDAVLAHQLIVCELPLLLSYAFPEMAPLAQLRRSARERLNHSLFEVLNGEGLVAVRHLPASRKLLASWTRCAAIGGQVAKGAWPKAAQRQYCLAVRQALRASDPEGRMLLVGDEPWNAEFLHAALRLGGRRQDWVAAHKLLGADSPDHPKIGRRAQGPQPSYHCEWSTLALMRGDWSPSSPIIAVDYSAPQMTLDLRLGRHRLLSGAWNTEIMLGGEPAMSDGPWEELCWFTDKDVDYLELVMPLANDARLERQILFARREQMLMLADHVQLREAGELTYVGEFGLAGGVAFRGEAETRDGALLAGADALARVMPLALPEWRLDPRIGELGMRGGALRLCQQTHARAMACPVLLDLDAARLSQPCTWRQLTVAEGLKIVTPDVAVGYRAQSGTRQWLMYRSQGPRGNRTLLGQNTSSEFFAARFKPRTGNVSDLIEIEG